MSARPSLTVPGTHGQPYFVGSNRTCRSESRNFKRTSHEASSGRQPSRVSSEAENVAGAAPKIISAIVVSYVEFSFHACAPSVNCGGILFTEALYASSPFLQFCEEIIWSLPRHWPVEFTFRASRRLVADLLPPSSLFSRCRDQLPVGSVVLWPSSCERRHLGNQSSAPLTLAHLRVEHQSRMGFVVLSSLS